MTSEEQRNLDLIVTLAVIVGHCNVLYEMLEEGSAQARRLAVIRRMAASAMKDLTEHQQKNGSVETKSGISNPAPATESLPPAYRKPATENAAENPNGGRKPRTQNQTQSLPNTG